MPSGRTQNTMTLRLTRGMISAMVFLLYPRLGPRPERGAT